MVPGTDLSIVPDLLRRRIAHRPQLLKIIDNIGWLFFDKVLRMGVGLLVGVWIARYLGPEQFGLLSFATAFVGLFGAFAGLGLQGIVVRDIVLEPAGKGETLGTAAVLHVLGGLVAYGLILLVIFWLRPEDTLAKTLVAILGSMMLFKASDVAVYWFESQVLSKYTVLVQNGTFLAFALVKVVLILQDAPLVLFAWMVMGEAFAGAVLMFWAISRVGFPLAGLRATAIRAGEMLRASWPLLVSGVAITVYMKVDQIMLGQIIGDKAVGLYSAATRISEVWYFVPMAIVASVLPAILQSRMASEAQYYRRLQLLFDVMVWLSIGVAVPMTFLSTPVVTLLFGSDYAAAGEVLAVHIWAAIFVFLGVASSNWYLAENRLVLNLQRAILGMAVNVVLNLCLIPSYGALGAAWATVISYAAAAFFFDLLQRETRRIFVMKVASFNIFGVIPRIVSFRW